MIDELGAFVISGCYDYLYGRINHVRPCPEQHFSN